jgi:hypothetical protein
MTKRANQRDRILALLQAAGPTGCTNLLLSRIGLRYGSRVWELRKSWDIETVQESETIFRFILKGRKAAQQMKLLDVA